MKQINVLPVFKNAFSVVFIVTTEVGWCHIQVFVRLTWNLNGAGTKTGTSYEVRSFMTKQNNRAKLWNDSSMTKHRAAYGRSPRHGTVLTYTQMCFLWLGTLCDTHTRARLLWCEALCCHQLQSWLYLRNSASPTELIWVYKFLQLWEKEERGWGWMEHVMILQSTQLVRFYRP